LDSNSGPIRVNIFNQIYSLRSADGDAEHLRRVAQIVDERMRAIGSQLAVHDVAKVAVLAALNLADELEVLKDSFERELSALLSLPPEELLAAGDEAQVFDEQETSAGAPAPSAETPALSAEAPRDEDSPTAGAGDEEQSWFDSIFDPGATVRDGERLSAQVSTRLKSHVGARLRRLRQSATKPTITEDTGTGH
jgi:cell division protein ZapA